MDGYSGADNEQVVITGLKLAFHEGCELGTEHLLAAVPEVRPLSRTDPERVAAITGWLAGHAKPAGTGRATTGPSPVMPRQRSRRRQRSCWHRSETGARMNG